MQVCSLSEACHGAPTHPPTQSAVAGLIRRVSPRKLPLSPGVGTLPPTARAGVSRTTLLIGFLFRRLVASHAAPGVGFLCRVGHSIERGFMLLLKFLPLLRSLSLLGVKVFGVGRLDQQRDDCWSKEKYSH